MLSRNPWVNTMVYFTRSPYIVVLYDMKRYEYYGPNLYILKGYWGKFILNFLNFLK